MTATVNGAATAGAVQGLWQRQLDHYPDTRPRMWYLAIVVVATIILYYEFYIAGAVSPTIIAAYGMTFPFYVYITVVANAVGAFGSLAAGLADRWGRANLVAYGLLITGLLVLIGIPNASGKWSYRGPVRGHRPGRGRHPRRHAGAGPRLLAAARPGLRDGLLDPRPGHRQPPRGGRVQQHAEPPARLAGPVHHRRHRRDRRRLDRAGWGCGSCRRSCATSSWSRSRDRALIEAKARGLDIEDSLKKPWRQMLHLDIIGSAFAISVFLLIYYTAVGFFTVYFTSLHGFSLSTANSIGDWFWAFDAGGADPRRDHLRPDASPQAVHGHRRGRRRS